MAKVQYSDLNLKECQCPKCPVELRSECVKDKMEEVETELLKKDLPAPAQTPELYCSRGMSFCQDLRHNRACVCPTCPVWQKDHLGSTYYCFNGSAEVNG